MSGAVKACLVRIADGLIEEAVERIRHPSRNRAEDLHEVRVTIKYLRAILRLVHPTLANSFIKRENARLRSATNRLAPLRDIDVARSTIGKVLKKLADRKDRSALRTAQRGFDEASLAQPQSDAQREAGLRQAADALGKTRRDFEAVPWPDSGWETIEPGLEPGQVWGAWNSAAYHDLFDETQTEVEAEERGIGQSGF